MVLVLAHETNNLCYVLGDGIPKYRNTILDGADFGDHVFQMYSRQNISLGVGKPSNKSYKVRTLHPLTFRYARGTQNFLLTSCPILVINFGPAQWSAQTHRHLSIANPCWFPPGTQPETPGGAKLPQSQTLYTNIFRFHRLITPPLFPTT